MCISFVTVDVLSIEFDIYDIFVPHSDNDLGVPVHDYA